ncbi:gamma-secretase subunit APH-1A isoform X1 [Paroedura picta]|uniref:gamma-secretase subunit APH-1A isoform X1 n=1 Tax=Paroedura picta TaxID=143630 RepID=UPI00405661C4
MGAAVFFGCACIAFGPALALCLLTVAGDPLRVLLLVAGAFFWLVSLLLASLIWFVLVQLTDRDDAQLQYGLLLFGAALSVLLQEAFRFAYFRLLKKADEGLVTLSEDGRPPLSVKQMAYVSGLSFGIISGLISVINILADSIGPGTVGIHGDSPHYFITSAFLTMALVFLHTFWGTIFFDACEKRRYGTLGLVVTSHLVTSGLTFLNPRYEASLIPLFLLTLSTGAWAFFTAGGSLQSIQACLSGKKKEDDSVMVYSALQLPAED